MVVSRNGQESQSSKKPTTDYYVRGGYVKQFTAGVFPQQKYFISFFECRVPFCGSEPDILLLFSANLARQSEILEARFVCLHYSERAARRLDSTFEVAVP